jgi:hypothetical protein
MTNKIRNVTKQLLGAEDVLFGRGTVRQRRGASEVDVHRLDLALPVADEAELSTTDATLYPKASIGSRNFIAINGQYQELSTLQPVIYKVGATLSSEYPYCSDEDAIALWTGAFPKTVTLADKGFSNPGWEVVSTGLGRGIVSEDLPAASFTRQGVRWYKPSEATTYVYYEDGDSGQWVQEPVQSAEGTLRDELSDANSLVPIGGVPAGDIQKFIASASDLRVTEGGINGQMANLISYHDGWAAQLLPPSGGGLMYWNAASVEPDDNVSVYGSLPTGRWIRQNINEVIVRKDNRFIYLLLSVEG